MLTNAKIFEVLLIFSFSMTAIVFPRQTFLHIFNILSSLNWCRQLQQIYVYTYIQFGYKHSDR